MSTPQKSFFAVDQETGATYRFNETDWANKMNRFMELHPNADIIEYDTFNPEDTQDTDSIYVTTGNSAYSFSPSEWQEKQSRFAELHPDHQVSRLRGVDYYYNQAQDLENGIREKDEQLKAWQDSREERTGGADWSSVMLQQNGLSPIGSGFDPERDEAIASYVVEGQQLQEERNRLQEAYDNNPRVKAAREEWQKQAEEEFARYKREYIDMQKQQILNDMESDLDALSASKGRLASADEAFALFNNETDNYLEKEKQERYMAAMQFLDKAEESRAGKLKGFWKGAGSVAEHMLNEASSQKDIATYADIFNVMQKLEKKYGTLKDVSDEQIERTLDPSEKALLKAYFEYADAASEDSGDWKYRAGQVAGEGIKFAIEFALTGGVADAASAGLSKGVVAGLERWAAKALEGTFKGVARRVIAKAGTMATKGLSNAVIATALRPSTYTHMAQAATTIDKNGHLNPLKNIGMSFIDDTIETISEKSGDVIGKILGIPFKPVKGAMGKVWNKAFGGTKFGDWAKVITNGPIADYLKQGGWNGFPIEMLEEYVGNTMRLAYNPEALKEMHQDGNGLAMLLGFLPMSLIGGTINTASFGFANKRAVDSASAMREMLLVKGYDEGRADYLTDFKREVSPLELGNEIYALKEELKRQGASEKELETLSDYATAVAEYQTLRGGMKEMQSKERKQVMKEHDGQYGKFYQEDKNGAKSVTLAIDNNGRQYFLTSPANMGEYAAIDRETGKQVFLNESDIKMQDNVSIDNYLDGVIQGRREMAETERMYNERNEQIAKLDSLLPKTLNLGTKGEPQMVAVKDKSQKGVTVVNEEGDEIVLSWEQVGMKMGMPIKVLTDMQIAEAEAAAIGLGRTERKAQRATSQGDADAVQRQSESISQQVKDVTPLPEEEYTNKETGVVDEDAFWENNPEGWADYNDRIMQDGGQDTMEQIESGLTKLTQQMAELDKMKSDSPNARKTIKAQKANLQAKIDRLVALQQKYVQASIPEEQRKVELTLALRERVAEWRKRLGLNEEGLIVFESIEDVINSPYLSEKEKADVLEVIGRGKTEGWYNTASTRAFVFLPDINTAEELDKTIAHEVITHYGLHNLMGEKAYNELMDKVWDTMSDAARNAYYNYPGVASMQDADKRRRAAAEEFVASIAENVRLDQATAEQKSIWQRIVEFFRNLFKESNFSDIDIADIVRKNYQQLTEQAAQESVEEFKAEAQEQRENGIIPELIETEAQQADGTNLYSTATYHSWVDNLGHEHTGTREEVLTRMQNMGFSEAEIKDMAQRMDTAYAYMEKLRRLTNPDGTVRFDEFNKWAEKTPLYKQIGRDYVKAITSLVSNGDYPVNLEITTDCIKREAFTQLLNELVKRGAELSGMGPGEIVTIQKMMKQYGIEVACNLCFVEGKRLQIINWASQIVNDWNDALVEAGVETDEFFEFGKDGDAFIPADEWRTYEDKSKVAKVMRNLDDIALLFQGLDPKTFKAQKRKNKKALDKYIKEKAEKSKNPDQWKPSDEQKREMKKIANEGLYPTYVNENMEEYRNAFNAMRNEWLDKNPNADPLSFNPTQKQWEALGKIRNRQIDNVRAKMVRLIMEYPEMRKKMTLNDLLGSKGLMEIRQQHGQAYADLYSIILQRFGTGTPKPVQDAVPYDGEVMTLSESAFKKANEIGGARLFSFSDFDITKAFDYMQMFFDLEANRQMLQSYTKEVAAVLIFGRSNAKFNISTLANAIVPDSVKGEYNKASEEKKQELRHKWAEYAGLEVDAEGNIIGINFSEEHSVSPTFAQQIFHDDSRNKDCGAIMVGASVNHAIFSAAQQWIRMVIPFHLSGMPMAAREKTDVKWYTDNTAYQSTRKKTKDGWSKISSSEDTFKFYNDMNKEGWNMRDKTREYLAWCAEKGFRPKFDWGINSDYYRAYCEENGYTPNQQIIDIMDADTTDGVWNQYYKFLTDFTAYKPVFNEQGEMIDEIPSPQLPVQSNFDFSEMEKDVLFEGERSMLEHREDNIQRTNRHIEILAEQATAYLNGDITEEEMGLRDDVHFENTADAERYLEEVAKENGTNMYKTRITPEQDAAYMNAVEAGDMETAQRMVIEAAKLAMPNTKVVDEDGNPKVVYHGTGSKFYTFRDTSDSNELGAGYYFSDSYEMAERYATDETLADNRFRAEALAFDIFTDEMGHSEEDYDDNEFIDDYNESYAQAVERLFGNGHVKSVFLNLENPRIMSRNSESFDPTYKYGYNHYNEGAMAKRFNDGVIDEMFTERHEGLTGNQYVAFSPSQIKSADPVTYDNDGNVIPLSERFNEEKDDIRFKTANNNQAIFVSNAAKAVEGIKMEKATPEQWLKMIEKNGGLKAGEDKWMGLSDWLKASDKKTLTKQEVLDFVNEHMIQIEEQHYGINLMEDREQALHDNMIKTYGEDFYKRFVGDAFIFEDSLYGGDWHLSIQFDDTAAELYNENNEDQVDYNEDEGGLSIQDKEKVRQWATAIAREMESVDKVRQINPTRLKYTTNGLKNKHEIALTVPTIEPYKGSSPEVHFYDAGEGRAVAWVRFGDASKWVAEQREDGKKGRTKKVLVIDEVQSQRHQDAREVKPDGKVDENGKKERIGYRDDAKIAELKAKADSLRAEQEQIAKDILHKQGYIFHDEEGGKFSEKQEYDALTGRIGSQEQMARQKEIDTELYNINHTLRGMYNGIPAAPFENNWHELAMKRMLRYAAENGYDVVAWTKGEQQAKRYGLKEVVNDVTASEWDSFAGWQDVKIISASLKNEGELQYVVDKEGKIVGDINDQHEGRNIAEVFGKEIAVKLLADGEVELSNAELILGSEGMKGFYDKILPAFMNKYGKKWGVKVEDIHLNLEGGLDMHSIPVTEEMKASVMEGQTMFRTRRSDESPAEFLKEAAAEFENKYNVAAPASIIKVPTRREFAKALDLELADIDEQFHNSLLDAWKNAFGMYLPLYDEDNNITHNIVIFAKDTHRASYISDASLFHENIHGFVKDNPELLELGRWLYETDVQDRNILTIRPLADTYPEHKRHEEMLTHYVSMMMAVGGSQRALDTLPEEYKPLLNYIYERFGYNPETEDGERLRRYDSESREISGRTWTNGQGVTVTKGERESDGNLFRTEISPEVRREMDVISAQAIVNGNYMKAPNGKDSKLTPEQWAMVRTKNFKQWFGDWENDPENASKVVDENGEPMVVHHGTAGVIDRFEDQQRSPGFWFVNREDVANGYAESASAEFGEEKNIISVFLNIRNPRVEDAHAEYPAEFTLKSYVENDNGVYEVFDTYEEAEAYREANVPDGWVGAAEVGDQHDLVERAMELGHDGLVMMNMYDQAAYAETGVKGTQTNYVVLDANQIKSATDNTGEFSEDADIRFKFIGEKGAANLDKFEEASTRLDNLAIAREMESAGKDAKTIKLATGWEKGADDKWRYEVEDLRVKPIMDWLMSKKKLTLKDIIEDSEVLRAYPDLENIAIVKNKSKRDLGAWYNYKTNEMQLPFGALKDDLDDIETYGEKYQRAFDEHVAMMVEDIYHEVQHAIQRREGFAKGGSPSTIVDQDRISVLNEMIQEQNVLVNRFNMHPYKRSAEAQDIVRQANSLFSRINQLKRRYQIGEEGYRRLAGETEARNVVARMNMSAEERRNTLASETEDVAREDQIILMEGLGVADNIVAEPTLEESTGEDVRFKTRTAPAPTKTQDVYKLMRLGADGKLYPLFIGSAEPIELGTWYDAESPNLGDLTKLASGVHLVNNETGEAMTLDEFKAQHPEITIKGKRPNVAAINWATENGARWIEIEDKATAQRRYEGESRSYYNLGINGSGQVGQFAMRPGWHAGSLPTMRQIGKGKDKNLRDDSFVWVKGRIPVDVDYQSEADANPDKDIPTHIPTDGFYMKATNANAKASQADKMGWYVAGSFIADEIISDAEARSAIDSWNAEHPDAKVEYDYARESGREYDPARGGLVEKDEILFSTDPAAMDVDELVEKGRQKALNDNTAAADAFMDRVRAINGNLNDLRRAASAQRKYDKDTIQILTSLANELLEQGRLADMTRGEVKRLIGAISSATGKSDLTKSVNRLLDVMIANQLRFGRDRLDKFLRIRGKKVDQRGVEVRGRLDIEGQQIMDAIRDNIGLSLPEIEDRIAIVQDNLMSESETIRRNAENELVGLEFARQYVENIKQSENEEKALRREVKDAEAEYKAGARDRKTYTDFVKATDEAIRENRTQRVMAYEQLIEDLAKKVTKSIQNAGQLREAEKQRVQQIQHFANSDMQGMRADAHKQADNKFWNSGLVRLFTSPLATFEQWLRVFGSKSPDGKGYLYNHFMGMWNKATNQEYLGMKEANAILDAKAREVFGNKVSRWSDIFALEKELSKGKTSTISFWDDGEMKEYEVTPGNLLYIYMVNKMVDGKMKLRKMGISEDDVDAIVRELDPRFITLADWIQDEFLPSLRDKYNAVHERLFGAPMAAIDSYFPIKVLANARVREVDLGTPEASAKPSTITGSIIKRTKNSLALDVLNSDAFDVVLEHVEQMEHWAAFAEFNRDLNTLLSYRKFRNRVQNMSGVLGSGKEAWNSFKETAEIAAGVYQPKTAKADKLLTNAVKGLTAGKISFRMWTAIKQILSMPAFFPYVGAQEMVKSMATPWKAWNWAMDNLPAFEKRWKSREAGNVRLKATEADWKLWQSNAMEIATRMGMTANAFVDAVTCAIGAYAVYNTQLEKYNAEYGYQENQAKEKAKLDATIAFNATQQSSESAFLSAVQSDRTFIAHALTVFRNNSFGMQREMVDSLRNFKKRMKPGFKQESIEFMKKQMVRDGLTEEDAERAANRIYRISIIKDAARIATFGFLMQFLWNLGGSAIYLLFGDDEEEKDKMIKDAAIRGAFGSIEGLGFGNVITEGMSMAIAGDLKKFHPSLSPAGADIETLWNELLSDPVAGASELVNLLVQAGFGVNPQVLADAVVAIVDACDGDMKTSKEVGIALLRMLQVPQSQVDKLKMDEIDFTKDRGLDLTIGEFAKEYAEYKKQRNAPYTEWLYSDEKEREVEDKYIKRFIKEAEALKRTRGNEEAKKYYEFLDNEYKEVNETINEMKRKVKEEAQRGNQVGSLEFANQLRDYMESDVFKHYSKYAGYAKAVERLSEQMKKMDLQTRASLEDAMLETRRIMVQEMERAND